MASSRREIELDADYQHISSALNMPIGSIGPSARSLARLQRHSELREFATAS